MAITTGNVIPSAQLIQLEVAGDGTSTTFSRDISKQPFELQLDAIPDTMVIHVDSDADDLTATGTIVKDGGGNPILTVTFSAPPPASTIDGQLVNVTINLGYSG